MMPTKSIPSTRSVFVIAWPLALKAVMLHGIIVIDAYLVSSLGEEALAAMGLAGAVASLLLGILFAFSSATQIRIAQAFGSSGSIALKTGLYCGMIINITATAIGLAIVLIIGPEIIVSLAKTPWIAEQAIAYLSVMLFVVLSEAIGQCLSSHFNGCGNTRITFLSYLIALPINIGVSITLIHGLYGFPEFGVVGAAYGTVLGSIIRLLFLGLFLLRDNGAYLGVRGWSQGSFLAALRRHFVFSWPIAVTFISMSVGNQVCMLIYAKMSVNQFAAMTLMMPWVQVAGTFGMSWAQATGICIAQLLGRGASEPELDQFLSQAWRAAFVAAGLVSATYLAICLSSGWIYDGLKDETTAALLAFLPILVLLPFPKGSNAICGQTLRASGDTVYVMNIFVSAQWLFKVPMTALFVLVHGLPVAVVFSLLILEEFFKFPLFHRRLLSGAWKRPTEVLS